MQRMHLEKGTAGRYEQVELCGVVKHDLAPKPGPRFIAVSQRNPIRIKVPCCYLDLLIRETSPEAHRGPPGKRGVGKRKIWRLDNATVYLGPRSGGWAV